MIDDNIKLEKYNMNNIVQNIHYYDRNYDRNYDKNYNKNNDTINTNEKNSLDKYKKLYNVYEKLFDNNICLLYNCLTTGMYSVFINANKIYKIINTDLILLYTNDTNNKYIYKTSFKTSQLAKNIHMLLKNHYSVILINPQYNVIAVHHPVNKYNTYFIPF